MVYDRFKKKYRVPEGSARLRSQIALEAARRLIQTFAPKDDDGDSVSDSLDWIESVNTSDYYLAKRKAAAVLGHRVRQGDLPSDGEVREHVNTLLRPGSATPEQREPIADPDDTEEGAVPHISEHLDRFTIYRMRLEPLESVKQNPKYHPEGDALFHSLQVFELARAERPYDEEFLLAALLHDVGKAIEYDDHVAAAVESLRGAVTDRTLWLIEHHMDLLKARKKLLDSRTRQLIDVSEHLEDLELLRKLDDAGRVPGQPVGTVEEALAYIRGIEGEEYLEN